MMTRLVILTVTINPNPDFPLPAQLRGFETRDASVAGSQLCP